MRGAWLVVAIAACGRLGFDARDDAATGAHDGAAPHDVATAGGDTGGHTDAGSGSAFDCWATWHTGAPSLTTPVAIAELNTLDNDERDPSLTGDALTVYYTSVAAGSNFPNHLLRATRATRASSFGSAVDVTDLESVDVSKLSLAVQDTVGVISADYGGGQGNEDLWQTTRTVGDSFTQPSQMLTSALVTASHEVDPTLSDDGTILYYSRLDQTLTTQKIVRATRGGINDAFAAPTEIATGSTDQVGDPAVSPDELVLLYTERTTSAVAIATRQSTGDAFQRVGPLTAIDRPDGHDAAFSRDGCELFFTSTRAGSFDLYETTVVGASL